MEPSPSAGTLAARPQCKAFVVTCLHCRDLDTPRYYLVEILGPKPLERRQKCCISPTEKVPYFLRDQHVCINVVKIRNPHLYEYEVFVLIISSTLCCYSECRLEVGIYLIYCLKFPKLTLEVPKFTFPNKKAGRSPTSKFGFLYRTQACMWTVRNRRGY